MLPLSEPSLDVCACVCVTLHNVREVPAWTRAKTAEGQMPELRKVGLGKISCICCASDYASVCQTQRSVACPLHACTGACNGLTGYGKTRPEGRLEFPDFVTCSHIVTRSLTSVLLPLSWNVVYPLLIHTHTVTRLLHGEARCQRRVPPLPLSLTATVRSSRWGAIKPDNKHSPSIPVCWWWCCCCCCCRCRRAGGSTPATLVLTSTWVTQKSSRGRVLHNNEKASTRCMYGC